MSGSRGTNSSRKVTATHRKKKIHVEILAPLLGNPRTAYPSLFQLIPIIAAPLGSFLVPITSNQRHGTMAHACVRVCTSRISRGAQYWDTRQRTGGTFLAIQFL